MEGWTYKREKVFIKEHEPLNTQKLIVEEVIADFLLLKALMAYEAQCEARALAIEKEEERFKTIDEGNDELCQHIEKMSIKTEKNLKYSVLPT